MDAVLFEDERCGGMSPLNLLKHTGLLRRGTKTLMEAIAESVHATEVELWGRDKLAEVTETSFGVRCNRSHDFTVLLVNSRARPGAALAGVTAKTTPFAAFSDGGLVAARVSLKGVPPGVMSPSRVKEVARRHPRLDAGPDALMGGYWDIVAGNALAIAEQSRRFRDALPLPATAKVRGPPSNMQVRGDADIEEYVSFDCRLGPIIVEEGATLESFSRLEGPCYIGAHTKIVGGLVRGGTSIFEGCKVGGEVDNSIIMPHANKAHFGYVGDSYVGEWVNLGAGSTFSNLKNTYGTVKTTVDGKAVDSGMLKLGPAVGDLAKVSIGALVFAGKRVGTGSHVTGLAADDVPSFTYFDGGRGQMVELLLTSVLETQRRMKERRGESLSKAEEALISETFLATADERRRAGVRKGRIT